MEFLKFGKCLDDIRVFGKTLSHLAELLLGFQVLLEIKVPEFMVDLNLVVEFLYKELVRGIDIAEILDRNLSY